MYIEYLLNKKICSGFYSRTELKQIIDSIYKEMGISRKAKSTDIELWYECRPKSKRIDGKSTRGFEVLRPRFKIKD